MLEIFEDFVIYECNPPLNEKGPKEVCIYQNVLALVKSVIK
jgi:hypothetical protein